MGIPQDIELHITSLILLVLSSDSVLAVSGILAGLDLRNVFTSSAISEFILLCLTRISKAS